jgi:ankyrin repeat protein
LHYLAIENDLPAVQFLLAHGAEVDKRDSFGSTPLLSTAQLGYVELSLFLMQNGADVNARDDIMNYTPLHYAAEAGKADLLEALLLAGGRANTEDSTESLTDVLLPRKRALLLSVLQKHGINEAD